jgi:hypothetical protein
MERQILNWIATGRVGASSKAMAMAVAGIKVGKSHPSDPDDFNRCLLLLRDVPEIKQHMDKVAALSDTWAELVARWDEVESTFLSEVGLDWTKGNTAPKTYKLMKSIGC